MSYGTGSLIFITRRDKLANRGIDSQWSTPFWLKAQICQPFQGTDYPCDGGTIPDIVRQGPHMHINTTCNTWTTHATNTETTASTALYFFLSYFKQSCSLGLHGEPVCGARDCVRKIPPAGLSLLVFITRGKHKYCHRSYLLWSSWSESPLSTNLMWHLKAHRQSHSLAPGSRRPQNDAIK